MDVYSLKMMTKMKIIKKQLRRLGFRLFIGIRRAKSGVIEEREWRVDRQAAKPSSEPATNNIVPNLSSYCSVYSGPFHHSISVSGSSEYKINGKAVNAKEYNDALVEHNILVKAKNFLVFQGDVEAVASQSPKDLTRLIEQISGSVDL